MTLYAEFAPFDQDGRRKASIDPAYVLPGTRPMMVSYANARTSIKHFLARGWSVHSSAGSTLWVILKFCKANSIKVQVNINMDEVDQEVLGYEVKKL